MTGFNTVVGHGKYSLTFNTDNQFYYQHIQQAARDCVDGILPPPPLTNAQRIRAMSDEELAEFITGTDFCETTCHQEHVCDGQCKKPVLKWLKQEVSNAE